MSTSAGRRSTSSSGQPGSNGEFYRIPTGSTPPPATETTAMSGTGKPGGARWTPVWGLRDRTHPEAGWIDKNPRWTKADHQCLTCGRIYAGPHKGEHPDHMVFGSHAYDRAHMRQEMDAKVERTMRSRYPGASDAEILAMVDSFRETHPYNDESFPE